MIDIIIPTYNQISTLPDTIQSVLDQTTFRFSKIIIVDDGSTDGTAEFLDDYKINSFKSINVIHQVNKGLSSARNTGIMNSTAEYILFLDSDDLLMPNCIEKMMEKIKETNADIIAPSLKCFGLSNDVVILQDNLTYKDFRDANRIPYASAIKREALLEIGGYSPKMVWGYEDLHLWINLLFRGKKIAVIKEPIFLYRTKQNSMYTESVKHHGELMAQIKKDFPSLYE